MQHVTSSLRSVGVLAAILKARAMTTHEYRGSAAR